MNSNKIYLTQYFNFNAFKRYNEWEGPLLNRKDLGCGINSLTFLEVLTRAQGENVLKKIANKGTPFVEMMQVLGKIRGMPKQYPYTFLIDTKENASNFINTLKNLLETNAGTIVKMMRYPDELPSKFHPKCNGINLTSGHTIIFSKIHKDIKIPVNLDINHKITEAYDIWKRLTTKNDGLFAIDPQQETIRFTENVDKAFSSWQHNCYKYALVMVSRINYKPQNYYISNQNIKQLEDELNDYNDPMDIDEDLDDPMDIDEDLEYYSDN